MQILRLIHPGFADISIGIASGRPQNPFFFPDQDYPIFDQPSPQPTPNFVPSQPQFTGTSVATATPTTVAGGVTTTTARPAPTTGSPAYIQCLANCPTTSEYNPVCGTDRVSYNNRQRLDCANFCGPRVNQQWTRK